MKAVNRTKTPWLVLNGHRPIYTTATGGASPYVRCPTPRHRGSCAGGCWPIAIGSGAKPFDRGTTPAQAVALSGFTLFS